MTNSFNALNYADGNFDQGSGTFHQIYGQFGTIDPTIDTTADLKIYDLSSLVKDSTKLDSACSDLKATIRVFCYIEDTTLGTSFQAPTLKTDNYASGVVWIYEPKVSEASFKDPDYTRVWRTTHELGHCVTEPFLIARYGASKRTGRLGKDSSVIWHLKKGPKSVKFGPLSIRQCQRAVEWESLAFRVQRILLEECGVTISEPEYQQEFNVNIADAISRVMTGEFSNPGLLGFTPSSTELDLKSMLFAIDAAARQIPMTPKFEKLVVSDAPDLSSWEPIDDADIKEAIELCHTDGIAVVHKNWNTYKIYSKYKPL